MQHLAEDTSSPFANTAELVPYTAFETEAGGGGVGGSRHAGALQDALWPSNLRENETQPGLPGGVELRPDHLTPELIDSLGRLYIVADGVTHCADGTTAARLAAQIIGQEYYQLSGRLPADPELWRRRLAVAFERAHERLQAWQERWYCAYYFKHTDEQPKLWQHQQVNWRGGQPLCPLCGERLRGLLSTAVAVVVGESRGNAVAVVAGVGDSPAYRLPPDTGATIHPLYSPRAKEFLGSPGRLQVHAQEPLPIYPGEWLLLGSDGVFSALSGRYGSAWPAALRQRLTPGRSQGQAAELYAAVPEFVRELGQWGAERANSAWHDDQALIVVTARAAPQTHWSSWRDPGVSTSAYVAPPALIGLDPNVPYAPPVAARSAPGHRPPARSSDTRPIYDDDAAHDTYDRPAPAHHSSSVSLPKAHAGVRRLPSLRRPRLPRLALPQRPGVKRVLFGLLAVGLIAALFLLNRDRAGRDATTSEATEAVVRNAPAVVVASTPTPAALATLPPTATPTGIPTSTPAVAMLVNPTVVTLGGVLPTSTVSAEEIPTTTPVPLGHSLPPLPLDYGPNVALDIPSGSSYEAILQAVLGFQSETAAVEAAAAVAAFGLPRPPQGGVYPGFLPPVPYQYLLTGQLEPFAGTDPPDELTLSPSYDTGVQLHLSLTGVTDQELMVLADWVDQGRLVWLLAESPVLDEVVHDCRRSYPSGNCQLSRLLGQSGEVLLETSMVMGIDGQELVPLDTPASAGDPGWIFADLGPTGIALGLGNEQRALLGQRPQHFGLLEAQWVVEDGEWRLNLSRDVIFTRPAHVTAENRSYEMERLAYDTGEIQ